MKHLTALPFIALLICIASCTTEANELVENSNDCIVIEPQTIYSDSININELFDSIENVSLDGYGEEDFIPVIMLDSAEFFNHIKNAKFINPGISKLKSQGTIMFYPKGSLYEARIELRGFRVRYFTSYLYEFPTNMKEYSARYQRSENEYYGKCYGHARSNSEVDVCLDILEKVGNKEYVYSYTVGINAIIRNKEFIINPIGYL